MRSALSSRCGTSVRCAVLCCTPACVLGVGWAAWNASSSCDKALVRCCVQPFKAGAAAASRGMCCCCISTWFGVLPLTTTPFPCVPTFAGRGQWEGVGRLGWQLSPDCMANLKGIFHIQQLPGTMQASRVALAGGTRRMHALAC